MTKQTRNLLILFLTIFIVKASISFFMSGTYFYSDEACVVIKAKHFAETLQMLPCKEIAHAPANDPMPLYSIIIAPFFFFFKGFTSYQAVLVFNSLAISSLVFPLYWITKNFIKKEWIAYLIISVTLFLPQITVYEKMLLTESFFVFLNIWLLYFYGKYKTEKKDTRKYLLLTILFTILAGLERPFGFITSIALITNEIITAKNKKQILLILFPILILLSILTFSILGNIGSKIIDLSKIFYNIENLKSLIIALKNQLNSLSISTLFIPLLAFIAIFQSKTSPQLFKKTKWYLLSLFLLNFFISANHLYGYLITNSTTNLITRYINITAILLIFFTLTTLFNKTPHKFYKTTTIIILICFSAFIFFEAKFVKHSLNLDLSIFYKLNEKNQGNLITQGKMMELFFFPSIIILFSFYLLERKKIIATLLITLLLTWGGTMYYWNINYSREQNESNEVKMYFREKELKILYLQPQYANRIINFIYWDLLILTNNTINVHYFDTYKFNNNIDLYKSIETAYLRTFENIISDGKLHLPIEKNINNFFIYYPPQGQSYEEHIEILKSENKPFIEHSEQNDPQSTPSLTPQENDKEQS